MKVGRLLHLVSLDNPDAVTSDGDGNYVPTWTPLTPARAMMSIEPASPRDLERIAAGTVISTATHLLRGWYHAGVTTKTRITKGRRLIDGSLDTGSREFSVVGVQNVEERGREMVLIAVEIVQ